MNVSGVSKQDAIMCAQLVNMLKIGKFDVHGPDVVAMASTLQWVHDLAKKIADEFKSSQPTQLKPVLQTLTGKKSKKAK